MNDTEVKLLTLLNSYGDVVELDHKFDSATCIEQSPIHWLEATHVNVRLT